MYSKSAFPVINLVETGRSIERCRRQAGLTVRDLQTYFGFEYPQAIYKWQHGECLPTVDNLLALARLLRVNMEDLLVWNDPGDPPFLGDPRKTPAARKGTSFPCRFFIASYLSWPDHLIPLGADGLHHVGIGVHPALHDL